MADVNDPSNIGKKLEREFEMLEEADLDERDRDAIESFIEMRRDVQGRARNTLINDLGNLRRSGLRASVSLVDMRKPEFDAFLTLLQQPKGEGGYGLDRESSSMYGYTRTGRVFFKYLHSHPDYGDYAWWENVEIPKIDMKGSASRDEMLTGNEIEALKDAASGPRDRALISFLGDVGGRITLSLSLRVGDMYLDGDEPYFTPNYDVVDGLKDLELEEIPVLHSRGELRTYLRRDHPDRDNEDAPFWAKDRGYDPENPRESAVSSSRVRDVLKECAERAGIEKPVEPHNFRRTTATRLSNSDRLKPQEIQQITGWSSTTLHEMLDTYDYTEDSERNSKIHQSLGYSDGAVDGSNEDELALVTVVCGTCQEQYANARFCPRCGAPRNEDARALKREFDDELGDEVANADEPTEAVDIDMLRRFGRDHPELAVDALIEGMESAD